MSLGYVISNLRHHQTDIINSIVVSCITVTSKYAQWIDLKPNHIELTEIISHWLTRTIVNKNHMHVPTTMPDPHKVHTVRLVIHVQINQPIPSETVNRLWKCLWAMKTWSLRSYHVAITSRCHLIDITIISQGTKVSIFAHLLPLWFILTQNPHPTRSPFANNISLSTAAIMHVSLLSITNLLVMIEMQHMIWWWRTCLSDIYSPSFSGMRMTKSVDSHHKFNTERSDVSMLGVNWTLKHNSIEFNHVFLIAYFRVCVITSLGFTIWHIWQPDLVDNPWLGQWTSFVLRFVL